MSNDKMREQLLDALEFIFMLADKQKQIDCSREYQLIKAALTQKPSENRGTYHIDSFTCEGYAGTQQPESEAVDDWLVYCLEYIGAGDPDDIECDDYELYAENDEGQSGTITVSISETCRKAATALQGPQPSAQVPTRKGEIQKDWWIEKAKHLLEKGAGYADVQRNNLAADEDACMDDDESALWRDLEIHSVNCRNLIDFNLTAAPSIAEKDQ